MSRLKSYEIQPCDQSEPGRNFRRFKLFDSGGTRIEKFPNIISQIKILKTFVWSKFFSEKCRKTFCISKILLRILFTGQFVFFGFTI
jgi:hypothetical protein